MGLISISIDGYMIMYLEGPVTHSPVANRLAVELSLPVLTT